MSRSTANHRDQFINGTELIGPNEQGLGKTHMLRGLPHPPPFLEAAVRGALDNPSKAKDKLLQHALPMTKKEAPRLVV